MLVSRLRQFFSSPALLFAIAVCCFYGNEGGLRLGISAAFLTFIIVCQITRAIGVPPTSRIRKLLTRPSVQQILVGVLCGTIGLVTLITTPALTHRDYLFVGVALFACINNMCTARYMERGFTRTGNLTLASVLLVPQVWGLMSSGISLFYNGGITPYVSLPLLILAAWLGIFGRFGPYMVNAGMPFYLSMTHNVWYSFSNAVGADPNTLIIVSTLSSACGAMMLGRIAHREGGMQNIPASDIAYVEIPGLAYRAPRFVPDDVFAYTPVSFRV